MKDYKDPKPAQRQREQLKRELENDYRNAFGTKAGKKVLTHMLVELHFFDTVATEEEVALQNYAKNILSHMGVITAENVPRLAEALLSIPTRTREE